jgi:DNA-binding XRE family transcriptional regulator
VNIFKDAKSILDEAKRIEQYEERRRSRKCDWKDLADVAEYRKDQRYEEREKIILSVAPDRKCPSCSRLVMELSRWVVSKSEKSACCRSCWDRNKKSQAIEKPKQFSRLIFRPDIRCSIDRLAFLAAREEAGLTQSEFARRAGWSRSYQRKIEDGIVATVTVDTAETILVVLSEAKLDTPDYVTEFAENVMAQCGAIVRHRSMV